MCNNFKTDKPKRLRNNLALLIVLRAIFVYGFHMVVEKLKVNQSISSILSHLQNRA